MICKPCRTGADIKDKGPLATAAKREWHKKCLGSGHCDCQHQIDRKNIP